MSCICDTERARDEARCPIHGDEAQKVHRLKAEIDMLSRVEMARLVRFARVGHPYFETGPVYDHFECRFKQLGGMSPEISKEIGWTR